jgi:uncharacterized coiled-coil protein SlyX
MRQLRLFAILMIVLSLAFLVACAPMGQEAEVAPPPPVEEVEQEAQGVETEVEQDTEGVEAEVEGDMDAIDPRLEMLQGFTVEQRADFERELGVLAQEYDTRLTELEAQVSQLDEATQTEVNTQIAALRQQRDALQQQLDLLATASDEEWESFKTGIMAAIEAFEQSFEETESRVG